jgi:stage III sporulation protein AH
VKSQKKFLLLAMLLVGAACVWWLVQVDREVKKIEIVTGEELAVPGIIPGPEDMDENFDPAQFKAFFIEYRLQRDRVRAREVELLNQMIENEKISPEGKKQAEEQLLALVAQMEKELLVENMLKAQGYRDAIFFYRNGLANVVLEAERLSEQELVQVAQMVSRVAGVKMEEVTVVEHREK